MNFLIGCELDNGHIDFHKYGLCIQGGSYIEDSGAVTMGEPTIRVYADQVALGGPYSMRVHDFNATVGFYDDSPNTFQGTYTDINAAQVVEGDGLAGGVQSVVRRHTVISPNVVTNEPLVHYMKPGGKIRTKYSIQGETDVETVVSGGEFTIEGDTIRITSEDGSTVPHNLRFGGGSTGIAEKTGSILTVTAGTTETWEFREGTVYNFNPISDDTNWIGDSDQTVARAYLNVVKQKPLTVTELNAIGAGAVGEGARAFCTDSSVNTFGTTLAGSGSYNVPVYSDGTNWIVG